MTRARLGRLGLGLLVVILVGLWVQLALARPGGGQSYSRASRAWRSNGSSSSAWRSVGSAARSSSNSSDGTAGWSLFDLLAYSFVGRPSVGITWLVVLLVPYVLRLVYERRLKAWSTRSLGGEVAAPAAPPSSSPRRELARLRESDENFSLVLFDDFIYMLYAAVLRARGLGTAPLAPYLAPELVSGLTEPQLADVQGIIVGSLRYVQVTFAGEVVVELELESNYVELARNGEQRRFYAVDRMVVARAASAKSRPFARAHKLDCPNCGAPLEAVRGTQCSYCQQQVGFGRFDWVVRGFVNRSRDVCGPLLTGETPEAGTELPTIVESGAGAAFEQLQRRDPSFSWQTLTARVAYIFARLQEAWPAREPLAIRPYVSDNLFQSLYYWIDLYLQARCRNVNEDARIVRMELANVESDRSYDAVTLRVFATGVDYTVSDEGKLLSGSRSRERNYSEYWTVIRGSARSGPARGDANCPNCGAALRIAMSGCCEYCRTKVSAGEFDWVLSRIEQDDSYGNALR